ncbi:MAG: hypothetical protein QOJ95_4926, partial [Mycobacterium sp.]|nr:hypothetical protein [Mycobacterium sp.]
TLVYGALGVYNLALFTWLVPFLRTRRKTG